MGAVNFAGCKIDEIDLQLFTFFGKQDFKFCVNFLRCNTYLEFMRNNKFAITIVFGRQLPFPSIFQSGEFVKQLACCFHRRKEPHTTYWGGQYGLSYDT